jgi:hypothetical protein
MASCLPVVDEGRLKQDVIGRWIQQHSPVVCDNTDRESTLKRAADVAPRDAVQRVILRGRHHDQVGRAWVHVTPRRVNHTDKCEREGFPA